MASSFVIYKFFLQEEGRLSFEEYLSEKGTLSDFFVLDSLESYSLFIFRNWQLFLEKVRDLTAILGEFLCLSLFHCQSVFVHFYELRY